MSIDIYSIMFWVILFIIVMAGLSARGRRMNQQIRREIRREIGMIEVRVEQPLRIEFDPVLPEDISDDDECCICLVPLKGPSRIIETDCDHIFHYKCIKKWIRSDNELSRNCPLCLENL